MNEPLPEPQNPVYFLDQVAYAVSLFPWTDDDTTLDAHMGAHWDKKEETCERCLPTWKALPWSLRMDIRNNYELENEEQD